MTFAWTIAVIYNQPVLQRWAQGKWAVSWVSLFPLAFRCGSEWIWISRETKCDMAAYTLGDDIFRCDPWTYTVLESNAAEVCYHCLKKPASSSYGEGKVRKCKQCSLAHYCSTECQVFLWTPAIRFLGHKILCHFSAIFFVRFIVEEWLGGKAQDGVQSSGSCSER